MFYAAEESDLELVKLLVQGGANLSLKDMVCTESQPLSGKTSEITSQCRVAMLL